MIKIPSKLSQNSNQSLTSKTEPNSHFFFLYILAIGSNGSTGGVHFGFFHPFGNLLYIDLKSLPYLIVYLLSLNN